MHVQFTCLFIILQEEVHLVNETDRIPRIEVMSRARNGWQIRGRDNESSFVLAVRWPQRRLAASSCPSRSEEVLRQQPRPAARLAVASGPRALQGIAPSQQRLLCVDHFVPPEGRRAVFGSSVRRRRGPLPLQRGARRAVHIRRVYGGSWPRLAQYIQALVAARALLGLQSNLLLRAPLFISPVTR